MLGPVAAPVGKQVAGRGEHAVAQVVHVDEFTVARGAGVNGGPAPVLVVHGADDKER